MPGEMTSSWAMLMALGAFHGINPGMGWLFAVALGMQERRRGAVIRALVPLCAGHALAVAGAIGGYFAGRAVDKQLSYAYRPDSLTRSLAQAKAAESLGTGLDLRELTAETPRTPKSAYSAASPSQR